MKKLLFVISFLAASSAFAINWPTPTPQDPCANGRNCQGLNRSVQIDLFAVRGGIDSNAYLCGVELSHDCETCTEGQDFLDVHEGIFSLGKKIGSLQSKVTDATDNLRLTFGPNDRPRFIVLWLNSLKKGARFKLRYCADVRRVIAGHRFTKASVDFNPEVSVKAGSSLLGFFGIGNDLDVIGLDQLKYRVKRRCSTGLNTLGAWSETSFNLLPGQTATYNTPGGIPSLFTEANHSFLGTCLKGSCQWEIEIHEFDRCFRYLREVDASCSGSDCRPASLRVGLNFAVNPTFTCLQNCE